MLIHDLEMDTTDVRMPVWAPGSYLIREFARNVEGFKAFDDNGRQLAWKKSGKNSWLITTIGMRKLSIQYRVYANELTVRTSHIDESHAYLNGSSIWLYLKGHKNIPVSVKVKPFHLHKIVSTSLAKSADDPLTFLATDYDELVDSPFEIGNHTVLQYEALGAPHQVALYGRQHADAEKLVHDFKKIAEAAYQIFGHFPCKRYLVIIHHFPGGGGGLEHANSTTLHTTPAIYHRNYQGLLSLFAHEYFHLWNVKRLRPKGLGPFDYDQEVYTDLLWFAEGFTSFYDDLLPVRAGFVQPKEYLQSINNFINKVEQQPGTREQTLAESSWDAWIKFYRRDENSINSQVSYYEKGPLAALLLQAWILTESKGENSLDDVMKSLYTKYFLTENRGIVEDDIVETVRSIVGKDPSALLQKLVHQTSPLPYEELLSPLGITVRVSTPKALRLGMQGEGVGSSWVVKGVEKGGSSFLYGLSAGDELLTINGMAAAAYMREWMQNLKPGDKLLVQLLRRGEIKEVTIELKQEDRPTYLLQFHEKLTAEQKNLLHIWLRTSL
jgi:predicted metalloprotease with PDZ domain